MEQTGELCWTDNQAVGVLICRSILDSMPRMEKMVDKAESVRCFFKNVTTNLKSAVIQSHSETWVVLVAICSWLDGLICVLKQKRSEMKLIEPWAWRQIYHQRGSAATKLTYDLAAKYTNANGSLLPSSKNKLVSWSTVKPQDRCCAVTTVSPVLYSMIHTLKSVWKYRFNI